jgi:PAS domain S-box-containing protein
MGPANAQLRDQRRLAVLNASGLLDTPPEPVYDGLTRVARRALGVPLTLLNLVDSDRVYLKSIGGEPDLARGGRTVPLDATLCPLVVERDAPVHARDTSEHPWSDSAPRLPQLGFRAYAGAPLRLRGQVIGTLCALDRLPREWAKEETGLLDDLAACAARVLESEMPAGRPLSAPPTDFLEGITDGFFSLDRAWRFAYLNREAERLLGTRREALLGHEIWKEFPSLVQSPFYAAYQYAVREQTPVSFETRSVVRPDRWLEVKANPTPEGLAVYFHDVTPRYLAQERLRFLTRASRELSGSLDHETTLRTVVRLAVPILADYAFVDVVEENGAVRRAAAAHEDPSREGTVQRLLLHPPRLDSDRPSARVLRTGETVVCPESQWPPEGAADAPPELLETLGELGLEGYLVVPLATRTGTVGALFCAAATVGRTFGREERELAEELGRFAGMAVENARLHGRLQRAVEARDDVLALVSHDLRNHLGAIEVVVSVLRESAGSPAWSGEDREMLEMAARATTRMNRLMRDLLDVARAESGRLVLDRYPHRASALLMAAGELLRPQAEHKGVRIEVRRVAEELTLRADFERILQVLENLGGNAVKFARPGDHVVLGVRGEEREVRFTVADTGPGIEPDHIPHLFDRFWQARASQRGGAGLGLAIAKGIVEAHGGRIWVESAPGAGSAFHFALPRGESAG